ncbi:PP2C family protein-serine/threonine phosphatase [Streptomyces sp. NRRL WC-3549]|uniref:PP2C family protein-serine/threonine phosphatase n=1 Tax=Streptomyces sp. NRRL WC-3549 TaxID=1463925 RepID=UPI000AC17D4E|nr:PP2C family protein-serine/threonine phosphatase [Streptomyces sp. NRRL WC-3549]
MSQTRSMLRALSFDGDTAPGATLNRLDRILLATGGNSVTTACLCRFEPAHGGWLMRWSNAGHPPPLVLLPDGQVHFLDAEPGVPLGVDAGLGRPDHTYALAPGSTVVMYTDGVVERHDQPLQHGLDAFAVTAGSLAGEPLEQLCGVLADHYPGDGHDDMAVLVLRVPGEAARDGNRS